jgi:hypothetical protein
VHEGEIVKAKARDSLMALLDGHAAASGKSEDGLPGTRSTNSGALPLCEAERDVRVVLSPQELRGAVGAAAVARLSALLGRPVHKVTLRRVQSRGGSQAGDGSNAGPVVPFHTDFALRTLQVPLNDPAEYEGGRTVFVSEEGFHVPARVAGSAIVHDGRCLHGVTALTRGTRYSLFLSHLPPPAAAALGSNTPAGLDRLSYLVPIVTMQLVEFSFLSRPLWNRLRFTLFCVCSLALQEFAQKAVALLSELSDSELSQHVQQYLTSFNRLASRRGPLSDEGLLLQDVGIATMLVWQTHMLNPIKYSEACKAMHQDSVAVGREKSSAAVDAAHAVEWLLPAVRRQQAFLESVLSSCKGEDTDELDVDRAVQAATAEYEAFLGSLREQPVQEPSSALVDFVWHTHLLLPVRYAKDCVCLAGHFVVHVA